MGIYFGSRRHHKSRGMATHLRLGEKGAEKLRTAY